MTQTSGLVVTLAEELFTDQLTPTTTQIPRPTWVTNVGTLQRYLLNTTFSLLSTIHPNDDSDTTADMGYKC